MPRPSQLVGDAQAGCRAAAPARSGRRRGGSSRRRAGRPCARRAEAAAAGHASHARRRRARRRQQRGRRAMPSASSICQRARSGSATAFDDRAHLERGHARERRGAQHPEALHRLDLAAVAAAHPPDRADRQHEGIRQRRRAAASSSGIGADAFPTRERRPRVDQIAVDGFGSDHERGGGSVRAPAMPMWSTAVGRCSRERRGGRDGGLDRADPADEGFHPVDRRELSGGRGDDEHGRNARRPCRPATAGLRPCASSVRARSVAGAGTGRVRRAVNGAYEAAAAITPARVNTRSPFCASTRIVSPAREVALEQPQRERVLEQALDRPLERPRAVGRIPAGLGERLLRGVGQLELEAALGEPRRAAARAAARRSRRAARARAAGTRRSRRSGSGTRAGSARASPRRCGCSTS